MRITLNRFGPFLIYVKEGNQKNGVINITFLRFFRNTTYT
jgi:hypothetical protein